MRLTPILLASSLAITAVTGCASEAPAPATVHSLAVIDGTPQAAGLIAFINDDSTTFELLDIDVALNAATAQRLIDQRPFDSAEAIDDVYGVGPKTLAKLEAWVADNGWQPGPDEHLGTWDGISFTVTAAEKTLELVNTASEYALDVELALDARAVNSIMDARPLQSMAQVADLYYVGRTALDILRTEAIKPGDLAQGDCRSNADCGDGQRCNGIPHDGSSDLGRCIDLGYLPGEGDYCDAQTACGEGLECVGVKIWGDGSCSPLWMFGAFDNTTETAIADAVGFDAGVVESDVVVYGLATVPVDIVVLLDVEHANPADLVITLHDPNGEVGTVWNQEATADGYVVVYGIPGDGDVNGRWTLKVTDTVSGNVGTLNSWSLVLSSRWD